MLLKYNKYWSIFFGGLSEYSRTLVISSIKSDIAILETIDKILTLMFTCNQYLVPTPAHNIYLDEEK